MWRRGPGDVWLIAGDGTRSWLFNTAGGQRAEALPNEAELITQAELWGRERSDCPQPFADVLMLQPHQLGEDAFTLSPNQARRLLKAALGKTPSLARLQFVRHRCYGEDCISAKVKDHAEAEALHAALLAQLQLEPNIEHFARLQMRCHLPPVSEPFALSEPATR